jgi:hypothetical protein
MGIEVATQVGTTLGELLAVASTIIVALWMLGKIGMNQYMKRMDEKFTASDKRMDEKFKANDSRNDDRFKTIDAKLQTFDPLHGELARVDKDLVQVRLEMATSYVRQEGIRTLTTRMEQLFKEVFDKLDSKADKSECDKVHRQ